MDEFISLSWLVLAVPRIVCTAVRGVDSRGIASSFSLARALRSRSASLQFVADADFAFLCVSATSNAAAN